MKTTRATICWLFIALFWVSCATAPVRDIRPGEKPPTDSDEAGLWMYMDRAEKDLKNSGRVVTDETLNRYIGEVICRLSPEDCDGIRHYVVETPQFNAAMAPNGFMQIWSGLLLRARSEDQLAYVLGHEIAHYHRRHSLQQWRTVRNTASGLAVFQLLTAGVGFGVAGDVAYLVALAGIFAYSRDQEREADDIGLRTMAAAGYDPGEAAAVWLSLIKEQEASDRPDQFIFFASHPSSADRVAALEQQARDLDADVSDRPPSRERHLDAIAPFRADWLRDELRKSEYGATQVVLDQLFAGGRRPGELYFFQGELHRLRNGDGDIPKAISAYEEALSQPGAPPETQRSLGLLYWKMKRNQQAAAAFKGYLDAAPAAPDAEMIRAYIEELD